MKKITALLALVSLCSLSTVKAQQATWLDGWITNSPLSATNWAIGAYATYAPTLKVANSSKVGGGFLACYNFDNNVGTELALDYLGQLSLVTGDVTAQAPFHATTLVPSIKYFGGWATNLLITPEVRAGAATAYSGGGHFNGTLSGDIGMGGAVSYKHLYIGYDWGQWIGKSPYDVVRNHFFLVYKIGF